MRSLVRFLLTFLCSIIIASCLLCIIFPTSIDSDTDPEDEKGGLGGWFSFKDPVSLFSPTATISLTDDNSTFFNAKPAAFGPLLPSSGLTGPVWVGSGFADDKSSRRGMASTMEGELGCQDIPGWDGNWADAWLHNTGIGKVLWPEKKAAAATSDKARRPATQKTAKASLQSGEPPAEDDGTDDYLHFPLTGTKVAQVAKRTRTSTKSDELANIGSMQEAAEIKGRVVMLSRGGCGFSEKIKWAQRRGAAAVIVADNVRGGPLVRMYARGDISNITIPSLFTSHTTAHLLSHLIPSTTDSDGQPDTGKRLNGQSSKTSSIGASTISESKLATGTALPGNREAEHSLSLKGTGKSRAPDVTEKDASGKGFLAALGMSIRSTPKASAEYSAVRSVKEELKSSATPSKKGLKVNDAEADAGSVRSRGSGKQLNDGFIIGVQDWRDPDVVRHGGDSLTTSGCTTSATSTSFRSAATTNTHLKGGSITPGSGEYPSNNLVEMQASHMALTHGHQSAPTVQPRESWLRRLFGGSAKEGSSNAPSSKKVTTATTDLGSRTIPSNTDQKSSAEHEQPHFGLWVTLTPSDVNASPFFNTLFVLVVSPLITLSVVYAMLLLRSRIRRRRWRAPKSLVERLPVRVYQALSTHSSPTEEAPEATATSTTPLLAGSRPDRLSPRVRSRAASAAAASSLPTSSQYGSLESSSAEQEKTPSGLAQWRKKYGGRQRECVVCLEEYVDGVSRVMSLPCGHEFHVDCITPWLTTRRRTCPICKGDVVRSMAKPSAPDRAEGPTNAPIDDSSDEDVQQQAGERANRSASAALPILHPQQPADADIERADRPISPLREPGAPSTSWLSRNFNLGFAYLGVQHHDRGQPPLDRNR